MQNAPRGAFCITFDQHSALLLTFIKLPFVIKILVLSIFEWPFYTGFTVDYHILHVACSATCITHSKKQTTNALIRLCECTGWSAPLFASPKKIRLSCHGAYLESVHHFN